MNIEDELALIQNRGPADVPAAPEIAAAPISQPDDDMPDFEVNLPALPKEGAAGTWENMSAAWTEDTISRDRRSYNQKTRVTLAQSMFGQLPDDAKARIRDRRWDYENNWTDLEDLVLDEIGRDVARDPARYGDMPLTREAFDAEIIKQQKAELEEAQAVLARPGGFVTEFLGSAASTLASPAQAALMFAGGGAGSVLRVLATEMALGGLSEAVDLPDQFAAADRLGLPEPNAGAQIGLGAALGGGLAGAIMGAARIPSFTRQVIGRRAAERDAALAARPNGMDAQDAEISVDRAEAGLRSETSVQDVVQPERPPAGTMGAVLEGNPKNWEHIKNGIFAGESGGDYDALFGFSNRAGGAFANRKLTSMTVNEAIAFSSPNGEYGQWVKGKIGRVATPMGAYQVVGTTLKAAKKGLGLTGNEVMDRNLQDRIGKWIYKQQGTGAWEGYRGPRMDAPPPPSADAPRFSTSRGYTEQGQVSAGDDFRIDVDYQVVDLSSIFRATGDFQPRDRSRIASDAWISDTAARLDPAQLMPGPTADRGTPIVGPNGMIESGNGRYGAIERAYERHPDRAAAYRSQIEAAGYAIPEGVSRPVLIARRTSDLPPEQLKAFTVAAQDSGVAVMTPTEMARTSGRAMTAPVLMKLDPALPLTDAANGGFVRAALGSLPRSARNAMFDKDGLLNSAGRRQLREAIFARAWPDADIIARFAEGDAGELKTLLDALETAAPNWAALRADIEAGLVSPDMDISGFVLDAMRLIGAARDIAAREGLPMAKAVGELLDAVDLLEGPVAPLTVGLVKKFWTNGRAAKAADVASFLTRYADDARKAGATGGLFDAPGPRAVLQKIDGPAFAALPENMGAPRVVDSAEVQPAQTVEKGFDAGATSPEAEAADAAIVEELRAPEPAPQADTAAQDAARAELAGLRDDFGDVPMQLPDGTTASVREFLDDLDADAGFDAFIQACAITPTGATP